jgi:nucleotide-binding universal stress UspA family protein
MGQTRRMNSGHFVSSDDRSPEAEIERFLRGVRHILVPIHLAQDSLRTIAYAIRLGQHFGSRLTLLHVYQPPIAFGIPSGTSGNTELWKDRQEAEETLKAQGALVRAAYPSCEWVLRSGDYGYEGLVQRHGRQPFQLRPEVVSMIQTFGGTMLGTSRGPQNATEMVDGLEHLDIDILFIIAGDGTLKAGAALVQEIVRRGLRKSVVGIPKTIDNDISYLDKSFRFETALPRP